MNDKALDLVVEMVKANKADADKSFESIEEKLDELLAFKWKLAGITTILSLICGAIFQFIVAKVGA